VAKVLKIFLQELKEYTLEYEIIQRMEGDENLTLKSVTLLLKGKEIEAFLSTWKGSICFFRSYSRFPHSLPKAFATAFLFLESSNRCFNRGYFYSF